MFEDIPDSYEEEPPRPRDTKIDEAKEKLRQFFNKNKDGIFYGRQLEVVFEKEFFHWIIAKSRKELIREGFLRSEEIPLGKNTKVDFLFKRGFRYYRRQVNKNIKIIREYSKPEI